MLTIPRTPFSGGHGAWHELAVQHMVLGVHPRGLRSEAGRTCGPGCPTAAAMTTPAQEEPAGSAPQFGCAVEDTAAPLLHTGGARGPAGGRRPTRGSASPAALWGFTSQSGRSAASAGEIADGESPPHTGKTAPRIPNMSQLAAGRRSSKDRAAPNSCGVCPRAAVLHGWLHRPGPREAPVPLGAPGLHTQGWWRGWHLPWAQDAEQVCNLACAGSLAGSAAATSSVSALAAGQW